MKTEDGSGRLKREREQLLREWLAFNAIIECYGRPSHERFIRLVNRSLPNNSQLNKALAGQSLPEIISALESMLAELAASFSPTACLTDPAWHDKSQGLALSILTMQKVLTCYTEALRQEESQKEETPTPE